MSDFTYFSYTWGKLWVEWRKADVELHPLDSVSSEIVSLEASLKPLIVKLLNAEGKTAEELFASACEIRDRNVGRKIDLRAAVDMSNVCRVNCKYCPMRRDNLKSIHVNRATAEQVVFAAKTAYSLGFRQLFLQSGEDPMVTKTVIRALQIGKEHADWHFVLNLGNLTLGEYKQLHQAGAHGYLIKHETANPDLHLAYRGETLQNRVQHMLWAREAGLYIGSGIILGLPNQTDIDLADDLIFLGRLDSSRMVSCAPFTPSEELPEGFRNHPSGDFEKTKRFIALLRHCFSAARIPATSNLDSDKMLRSLTSKKSGQAEAIEAGANGITVQFTPREVEKDYGLYDRGFKRHLVYLEKAEQVASETSLPLNLL